MARPSSAHVIGGGAKAKPKPRAAHHFPVGVSKYAEAGESLAMLDYYVMYH